MLSATFNRQTAGIQTYALALLALSIDDDRQKREQDRRRKKLRPVIKPGP